jgi:hypothetical protein
LKTRCKYFASQRASARPDDTLVWLAASRLGEAGNSATVPNASTARERACDDYKFTPVSYDNLLRDAYRMEILYKSDDSAHGRLEMATGVKPA